MCSCSAVSAPTRWRCIFHALVASSCRAACPRHVYATFAERKAAHHPRKHCLTEDKSSSRVDGIGTLQLVSTRRAPIARTASANSDWVAALPDFIPVKNLRLFSAILLVSKSAHLSHCNPSTLHHVVPHHFVPALERHATPSRSADFTVGMKERWGTVMVNPRVEGSLRECSKSSNFCWANWRKSYLLLLFVCSRNMCSMLQSQ